MVLLAVAAEAIGVEQDGLRRGFERARQLAQPGARDQAVEHGGEERGALEPVGGAEGLLAEASPTVTAAEPLDPLGGGVAGEVAVAHAAPTAWGGME